jgi:hypothetical protein
MNRRRSRRLFAFRITSYMISKDAAAIIPDILIFYPFITTPLQPQQTETAHHDGLPTPTNPHLDTDSDFRHRPDCIRWNPQPGLSEFEKPRITPTTSRIGGTMATQTQNHSPNCLFHTSARKATNDRACSPLPTHISV